MSTLSLRLPESLHKELKNVAQREGISINQFISTAVAEKMSALMTEDYLAKRAKRGDKKSFKRILKKYRALNLLKKIGCKKGWRLKPNKVYGLLRLCEPPQDRQTATRFACR